MRLLVSPFAPRKVKGGRARPAFNTCVRGTVDVTYALIRSSSKTPALPSWNAVAVALSNFAPALIWNKTCVWPRKKEKGVPQVGEHGE